MSQLSDNENSKDSGKKLSSKEKSLSERLTGTDSDISAYSIAPIPVGLNQPLSPSPISLQGDTGEALKKSESPASSEHDYAGFIRRYFATVIDDFFLYWLVLGFIALYVGAEILGMHFLPRLLGVDFSRQMIDAANIVLLVPAIPLCVLLCWLYCSGLESSAMEATPGKRILRMRVLDINGKRLTFWRSTRKALIPATLVVVSLVGCLVTTLLIAFMKGPLAVVGTCLAVVTGLLAGAAFLTACLGNVFFINKKNQTVHDLLSKRIVVKRSKASLPSDSRGALFGLLPMELKILGLLCSAFIFLIAEYAFGAYCNAETKNSTPGVFVLNTSGHVWKTKKALKTGSIVDLKDCYQETLPVFRTPPFALNPSTKLGRMIVCGDLASDSILTYNSVIPQTIGVSQIISIEPIKESQELNYSISRVYGEPNGFSEQSAKHVDRQLEALKAKYPDEQWLIRILSGEIFRATAPPSDDVDKLRTVAVESNKGKKFSEALSCADKALSLIFERYAKQNPTSDLTPNSETGDEPESSAKKVNAPSAIRPSEVLAQAIKTSKMLPAKFPFDKLSVEYRAVLTDLLMQRSIAQTGLHHDVKAKVDAANCISLLKSLHQDSLVDRKSEFLGLPELDTSSDADSSSSSSSDAESEDSNAKTDAKSKATDDVATGNKATDDKATDQKATDQKATDAGNDADTSTGSADATDATESTEAKSNAEADTDAVPAPTVTDANANRYLSMLAKSDEKRYKDFLQQILKRLGN